MRRLGSVLLLLARILLTRLTLALATPTRLVSTARHLSPKTTPFLSPTQVVRSSLSGRTRESLLDPTIRTSLLPWLAHHNSWFGFLSSTLRTARLPTSLLKMI